MKVAIHPSRVTGVVHAPPSKSYTHRAIILGALASGRTEIESPLLSDDTLYTIEACRRLGIEIKQEEDRLLITGCDGHPPVNTDQTLFVGNSGTTLRLMAGVAALADATVVLDGDSFLRRRPVDDLLTALSGLGIPARALKSNGCPPIEVRGGNLRGGEISIRGDVSSQPISSLLMVAPFATEALKLTVTGKLHSRPYIAMTLDVMQDFGISVVNHQLRTFAVRNDRGYRGRRFRIEGDYTSAAYFLAAGAIGGGPVTVDNLKIFSQQGDRQLLTLLTLMGCTVDYLDDRVEVSRQGELSPIRVDMGDYPDIVPTLAVVAAFAHGRSEIVNIEHLRFKETDRIRGTTHALGRMGIRTEVHGDTMVIHGGTPRGTQLESFSDHRLAMSFVIAALFADGDSMINDAEVVTKSYPRFYDNLANLGSKIEVLS
jgi:3-phosphoshikimate 1-carboxyvinyltransferase